MQAACNSVPFASACASADVSVTRAALVPAAGGDAGSQMERVRSGHGEVEALKLADRPLGGAELVSSLSFVSSARAGKNQRRGARPIERVLPEKDDARDEGREVLFPLGESPRDFIDIARVHRDVGEVAEREVILVAELAVETLGHEAIASNTSRRASSGRSSMR